MGQYSSYYLYQKYERRCTACTEADWVPCYPNTYSISGDSTTPLAVVMKEENDTACGYIPKGSDDYDYEKWEVVDGYICDDTTKYARERKYVSDDNVNWTATDIYRRSTTVIAYNSTDCGYDPQWDNYNCHKWEVVSNDYICNEGNKYQKLRKYFRQCENCDSCSAEWLASDIYKQGDIIEYDSTDCGYIIGERMYRWITVGYYCVGYDKHYKQQKQISYYQGQIWENLNIFRDGGIYQKDSSDCMSSPVIYRWLTLNPSTDYYCSGTTKYYKEQYQKSYDNGTTWVNEVPPVYKWGTTAETQSTDCGYIPPQYRSISGESYCSGSTGYDKYVDVYSQVSYDGGSTWETTATTPTLIEINSEDCGYVPPQYRWYPSGTTCVGVDKWEQSIRQVSYDSGTTWINVDPPEYSATTLIEADSEDCGWSPTQYRWIQTTDTVCVEEFDGNGKLYVKYANNSTYELPCSNGSSALTLSMVRGGSQSYTSATEVWVGDCVKSISSNCITFMGGDAVPYGQNLRKIRFSQITIPTFGNYICGWNDGIISIGKQGSGADIEIPNIWTRIPYGFTFSCFRVQSLDIPSGITVINEYAFSNFAPIEKIVIPDSVTTIGFGAFGGCGADGYEDSSHIITGSHNVSVEIGTGCTSIGIMAFSMGDYVGLSDTISESNLKTFTIKALTPPTIPTGNRSIFIDDYHDVSVVLPQIDLKIYVPNESLNAYKTANGWSKYASIIFPIT